MVCYERKAKIILNHQSCAFVLRHYPLRFACKVVEMIPSFKYVTQRMPRTPQAILYAHSIVHSQPATDLPGTRPPPRMLRAVSLGPQCGLGGSESEGNHVLP